MYDVDGIAAVRYPKGGEWRIPEGFVPDYQPFTWYRSRRSDVLIVTYGRLFGNVLAAANELAQKGRYVSVLKLNRIKPIDPACIRVALTYFRVLFFEEGSRRGGVAEYFGSQLAENNFARRYEVYAIDRFIPCCSTEEGLHIVGLDVEGIVAAVEETVEMTSSDMDFEQLPADGEEPVFDSETDEEFEEASDGDTSLDKEHSDDAVDLAEPSVTVIADEITVSPVEEDITDE